MPVTTAAPAEGFDPDGDILSGATSRRYPRAMVHLLIRRRRPATYGEVLLVALAGVLLISAVLYALSLALGDVEPGRIAIYALCIPGVRMLLDALSPWNGRAEP